MLVFFAEKPSTIINGISLTNKRMYNLLKANQKVLWIEEFGYRKLVKEILSVLKVLKIVIYERKIKYFYCVIHASAFGLIKIIIILKLINIFNKNIKFLFHIHRNDVLKNISNNNLNKWTLNYIKKNQKYICMIFCISKKLKIDLSKFFENKIKILIKRNTLSFNHKIKPKTSFLQLKKIKLIYLSNIIKSKGILNLCEEISKKKYHNLYDLCIYGEILDLSSKFFFKNKKFKNIFIKKPLKDNKLKFNILKNFDALILPSKNEGDPLCIIEAMSVGLPAICYNVGYINETLGNKYDLYLNNNSLFKIYKKLKSTIYRKKISYYLVHKFKKRYKESRISDYDVNKNF
jgi:glycosyltransferase involved in cell wall biosynthesis